MVAPSSHSDWPSEPLPLPPQPDGQFIVPPIDVGHLPDQPEPATEPRRRKRPSPVLVLLAILMLLAALIGLAFLVWRI